MHDSFSKRSIEEELILGCAQTSIEPPEAERLGRLAGQDLDWAYVLEVSYRNGVGPLLYRSLKTFDQSAAPQPVMKQLQQHFYLNLAHNLRLETELATLLEKFEKHGILAIPYKGPALATFAYGDIALRVFGDLDILIQKAYVQGTVEAMIALGYQPDFHLEPKQLAAYVDTFYELPFSGAGKAPVEIHWEIYADHFAFPVAPLSIWHDKADDWCEQEYPSIPPEKLFLMLCVHGTQHYWGRLAWVCDIAELLRKSHRLDWEGLVNLAAQTGGLRMLSLGLHLAHELLGAPIPQEPLFRIGKDGAVAKAGRLIRERIFGRIDGNEGILETCLFYVRMRERLRDKARLLFRTFSRPIPGQWDRLGFDGPGGRLRNVMQHVRLGYGYGLSMVKQRLGTGKNESR